MARLLVYYAHPGEKFSHVNKAMASAARSVEGIDFVDLYAEYPRHNINVKKEQERLVEHDVILFQFPLFWYSTPSIIKEWQDLVLEYGFAYGHDGNALKDKVIMLAVSAGGPETAYQPDGYQNHPLTTFLTPLRQTATLCKMQYATPYVLFGALKASQEDRIEPHVNGYQDLLEALRDETYDFVAARGQDTINYETLPDLINGTGQGATS